MMERLCSGAFTSPLLAVQRNSIAQKGAASEVRGASVIARQFVGRAQGARTALMDGAVAAIVAPRGHLFLVLNFTIRNDKIVEIEAVADPARLRQLHLAVLDD